MAFRQQSSRDSVPGSGLQADFAGSICPPPPLACDLLPPTFAAVALLAGGSCDAPGRRLVQLVYRIPALQLALGTWHLPGPALIAPALVAWLLIRLRAAPRPALA